jgi:hypothetical protein
MHIDAGRAMTTINDVIVERTGCTGASRCWALVSGK